MKKKKLIGLLLILITVIIIILLIIFHYDKKICKNTIKEENFTINNIYKIYYKKDIVYKVLIERKVISKNNTILSFFENQSKEEINKNNKEFGGYKIISSTTKDNKYILKVELKLGKENVKKLSKNKYFLKNDIKNNKLKMEGIYKLLSIDKEKCSY